jgi:hypothetical protein
VAECRGVKVIDQTWLRIESGVVSLRAGIRLAQVGQMRGGRLPCGNGAFQCVKDGQEAGGKIRRCSEDASP